MAEHRKYLKKGDIYLYRGYKYNRDLGEYQEAKKCLLVLGTNTKGVISLPVSSKENIRGNSIAVNFSGIDYSVYFNEIYTEDYSNLMHKVGEIDKSVLGVIIDKTAEYIRNGKVYLPKNFGAKKIPNTFTSSTELIKIEQEGIDEQLKLVEYKKQELDVRKLTYDLIEIACRMTLRKATKYNEDELNDSVLDGLGNKGHNVADQSRGGPSGKKKKGTTGRLDIAVRGKTGLPDIIIEGFKLSTCGPRNKVALDHIEKTIKNYDTMGNKVNFVLIYAENKNFIKLWNDYQALINSNLKTILCNEIMSDISEEYTEKSEIKIGVTTYIKSNKERKLFHIFINMTV